MCCPRAASVQSIENDAKRNIVTITVARTFSLKRVVLLSGPVFAGLASWWFALSTVWRVSRRPRCDQLVSMLNLAVDSRFCVACAVSVFSGSLGDDNRRLSDIVVAPVDRNN